MHANVTEDVTEVNISLSFIHVYMYNVIYFSVTLQYGYLFYRTPGKPRAKQRKFSRLMK